MGRKVVLRLSERLLVYGDTHVEPGDDLRRMDALALCAMDYEVDGIVDLGDFNNNNSCHSHCESGDIADLSKTYLDQDEAAGREALDRFFHPMWDRGFEPWTLMTLGNHEYRWDIIRGRQPKVLWQFGDSIERFGYRDYFDEVLPYKSGGTSRDFIHFVHIPFTKMGRPIGGEMAARTAAMRADNHIIFGHTHTFAMMPVARWSEGYGVRMGISIPMYANQGHIPSYAKGSACGYMYGALIVETHDEPGRAPDVEFISTQRIIDTYL